MNAQFKSMLMSTAEMRTGLEKFQLIEWLVKLEDVATLERIKQLKQESEIAAYEASLKPMTVEELIARAEASNRDIEAGNVYDLDEVMKEDGD